MNNDIKPNYAVLGRQYGVDYRTAKRAYEEVLTGTNAVPVKRKRANLLDNYRDIICRKLGLNCSAQSIYKFIQKKGFQGKYIIVREYCVTVRKEQTHKATI
ncbi:hypothetical protein [Levilactobacillus namurensis]|uniref:hypothetical protein n=1 Tax=Levilactobacillus namurensis TaxID=380393 RepID=UPI00177C2F86|nr:hypothetical protein [Levilactobacillus namurensis]